MNTSFTHWSCLLIACAALAQDAPEPSLKVRIDFEASDVGKTPADFTAQLCGQGTPGLWEVREDASAPSGKKVLAQINADPTDFRFPILVYDKVTAKDVSVSVKLKPISGTKDQAGGLIVRYKDAKSYYLVRANALEGNVHLYRIVGGVRQRFAGADQKITPAAWHTLALDIKDAHFKISFDGKLLFEADDPTYPDPGKTGVWTKSDSLTLFDDLDITTFDDP